MFVLLCTMLKVSFLFRNEEFDAVYSHMFLAYIWDPIINIHAKGTEIGSKPNCHKKSQICIKFSLHILGKLCESDENLGQTDLGVLL